MNPPTNNWKKKRPEHSIFAEIVAEFITRNSEGKVI